MWQRWTLSRCLPYNNVYIYNKKKKTITIVNKPKEIFLIPQKRQIYVSFLINRKTRRKISDLSSAMYWQMLYHSLSEIEFTSSRWNNVSNLYCNRETLSFFSYRRRRIICFDLSSNVHICQSNNIMLKM
jgi:hypothetical protein